MLLLQDASGRIAAFFKSLLGAIGQAVIGDHRIMVVIYFQEDTLQYFPALCCIRWNADTHFCSGT
jgi:hypothetical protein